MAPGSSGGAARRGGRAAVPPKRELQSGVTDATSKKKQAVGGGGPAPSSAPVTQISAEEPMGAWHRLRRACVILRLMGNLQNWVTVEILAKHRRQSQEMMGHKSPLLQLLLRLLL